MILKLRIINYPIHKHYYGWEMISDVTSFRYMILDKDEVQDKEKIDKLKINDFIQLLDKNGEIDYKFNSYVYIQAWHKRDGDPLNIVTNLVAYILNDEGKTIERIN